MLTDRECRIIRLLAEGNSWEAACAVEGINSYNNRATVKRQLLTKLQLDDFTQVRLWASPIRDAELARLCGSRPTERTA